MRRDSHRWLAATAACLIVAAVAGACTDTARPKPTPVPSPTQFDGLRSWLTTERQEALADMVSTVAREHGWAAGCVFRYHPDEAVLHEFAWPAVKAAYSVVNDPKLYPAIVMYVEGSTTATGSFREVLPDAAFCYVPE